MILTLDDIHAFESAYEDYLDGTSDWLQFMAWLNDNPQLPIATQFQEFVAAHTTPLFQRLQKIRPGMLEELERPAFRTYSGQWVVLSFTGTLDTDEWDGYSLDALSALPALPDIPPIRQVDIEQHVQFERLLARQAWIDREISDRMGEIGYIDTKALDDIQDAFDALLHDDPLMQETNWPHLLVQLRQLIRLTQPHFEAKASHQMAEGDGDFCVITLASAAQMIDTAYGLIHSPMIEPTMLVSPQLWTPSKQDAEVRVLRNTTRALIDAVRGEERNLDEIHWRNFEDMVAELLRDRGMEIARIREHPQGGRDIIARGVLVPGMDPITIAVEVKHKPFVKRPEVQLALAQNSHFPSLMLVTSGRFSAGVFKEVGLPKNRLRLSLYDGERIRELIKNYPLQRSDSLTY